ncbi:hypothetical protein [Streptomyces sp. NPDC048106]|uniref:hypothetical protein n=1 Tax=Streptomyces sp. NPDC048106 TaxID=3155750 RepID=UPI003452EBD6
MRSTRMAISAAMLGALALPVLSATTASAAPTGVKGWVSGTYVYRDVRMCLG